MKRPSCDIILLSLSALLLFHTSSCRKADQPSAFNPGADTIGIPGNPLTYNAACEGRPLISARLIQIGKLSEGRVDMTASAAGSKILFAGGYAKSKVHFGWDSSTRVDILDTISQTWTTAELTRVGGQEWVSEGVIENKVFFAGGNEPNSSSPTTASIDVYDASTGNWSTDLLSEARTGIAVAAAGSKILFAGGLKYSYNPDLWQNSGTVDIYDLSADSWSKAALTEPRFKISATTVGSKVYLAGGNNSPYDGSYISGTIDIYDIAAQRWSASAMQQQKSYIASAAVGNRIFWAGSAGYTPAPPLSMSAEIRDLGTGKSEFACMIARSSLKAVIQHELIIFFTGYGSEPSSTHFEIFDTKTNIWKTAVLPHPLVGATIISVNNTIYVAGGTSTGFPPYYDKVWKMEFDN